MKNNRFESVIKHFYLANFYTIKSSTLDFLKSIYKTVDENLVVSLLRGETWREKRAGLYLVITMKITSFSDEIEALLFKENIKINTFCIIYFMLFAKKNDASSILEKYVRTKIGRDPTAEIQFALTAFEHINSKKIDDLSIIKNLENASKIKNEVAIITNNIKNIWNELGNNNM